MASLSEPVTSALSQLGQGWNNSPKYGPVHYRYNGELTARLLKDGQYLSKVGVFHPDVPKQESDIVALSYGYDWKVSVLSGGIRVRSADQCGDIVSDVWLKDRQDFKRIGLDGFKRPKSIELTAGSSVWFPASSWHRITRLNDDEATVVVYEAWKHEYRDPTRVVVRHGNEPTPFDSDTYSDDEKWSVIEDALAEIL